MGPDTTKQIIDALKPLADKLGQGGAHLYEVYVRQMIAEGILSVSFGTLSVIAGIIALTLFLRIFLHLDQWQEEGHHSSSLREEAIAKLWVFGISVLLLITAGLTAICTDTMKLINPEYAAIHRIIEDVRGPSN